MKGSGNCWWWLPVLLLFFCIGGGEAPPSALLFAGQTSVTRADIRWDKGEMASPLFLGPDFICWENRLPSNFAAQFSPQTINWC